MSQLLSDFSKPRVRTLGLTHLISGPGPDEQAAVVMLLSLSLLLLLMLWLLTSSELFHPATQTHSRDAGICGRTCVCHTSSSLLVCSIKHCTTATSGLSRTTHAVRGPSPWGLATKTKRNKTDGSAANAENAPVHVQRCGSKS